jgi:hypothetical protein
MLGDYGVPEVSIIRCEEHSGYIVKGINRIERCNGRTLTNCLNSSVHIEIYDCFYKRILDWNQDFKACPLAI